jgi:hypothetical protein
MKMDNLERICFGRRYDEASPICQSCEWRNECHKVCDEDRRNFALREKIQKINPPIQQNCLSDLYVLSDLHTPDLEPKTKQSNTRKKLKFTKEQIAEEEERQKHADEQWRTEEQIN